MYNPIALRRTKTAYSFGLSECNRVNASLPEGENCIGNKFIILNNFLCLLLAIEGSVLSIKGFIRVASSKICDKSCHYTVNLQNKPEDVLNISKTITVILFDLHCHS